MTELEKCNAGQFYRTDLLGRERQHLYAAKLCFAYNNTNPLNIKRRKRIIKKLFGKVGEDFLIETGLQCSFGFNISIGDRFFANNRCLFMDDREIIFGDNVLIGPSCEFYTAQHPINAQLRNQKLERALPITVGNSVWFGGGCIILPGVTIGSNTVIGAGSVVTRNIGSDVVAAGNPCRILRRITPADME